MVIPLTLNSNICTVLLFWNVNFSKAVTRMMTMIRLMAVKAGSSEALHPPTLTFPPTPPAAQPAAAAHSTAHSTQHTTVPECKNQELGELVEHANAPRTRQFQDLASFDNLSVCLPPPHNPTKACQRKLLPGTRSSMQKRPHLFFLL